MRAEKEADLWHVLIDKTSTIEEALPGHLVIVLSGMHGVGKKTAVRMLLQKHPEVNAVFCNAEDLRDKSAPGRRKEGTVNWYLIRNAEDRRCGDLKGELLQFIRHMQREDRIFLAVDGIVPPCLLELVWNGMAAVILPETFWFSEGEVYRYLKLCRSRLDCREVFRITGGWAGCAAMLVRLEQQLGEGWSARELASRYEVRRYIRTQIAAVLTQRERKVLTERVPFPRLSEELAVLLWTEWDKETEDSLLVRGAMRFVPGQKCWHVHPALRAGIDESWDRSVLLRAVEWYEKNGYVQDALECTAQMHDTEEYRDCLVRNYDRISFLTYDKVWEEKDLEMPEFYLVTVYTPNSQDELRRLDYRMQWEDDFRKYLKELDAQKPVIVCGDLNVAHKEIDLKNPKTNRRNAGFTDEEREKFSTLLADGFTDSFRYFYPDLEGAYSWWSYRFRAREKNAGWRIDYFLVSERLNEKLTGAKIHNQIFGSDHCPVELTLEL